MLNFSIASCLSNRVVKHVMGFNRPKLNIFKGSLIGGLLLLSACATADTQTCQTTNAALEAMPPIQVKITRSDGTEYQMTAKLANNNYTRAAGFQNVCGSTMKETPILFIFEQPVIPSFHMNNVVAPIDIAFVRQDSSIDVIHAMQPYSLVSLAKPLYSPKTPVIAALETHKGFYDEHGFGLDSSISWYEVEQSKADAK